MQPGAQRLRNVVVVLPPVDDPIRSVSLSELLLRTDKWNG